MKSKRLHVDEVLEEVSRHKRRLLTRLIRLWKQFTASLPACNCNRRKFVSIWKRVSTRSRCSASAIRLCQRRLNSFGNPKRIFFDRKVRAISENEQQLS